MRKSSALLLAVLVLILLSVGAWTAGLRAATAASPKNSSTANAARLPSAAFAAMDTINPEHLRAHVRFLSDDLLEGRGTGQRGGDIAAQYIATQFALYGLKPAGDNGTYMQKVPMVGTTLSPETTFSLVPAKGSPRDLKFLSDYNAYDDTQQA